MNISDAYPRRKSSQTANYGYNNSLATLAVSQDSTDFSATYDYVMVFPMKGDNHDYQSKYAKHCIHELLAAGLEVFPYLSVQFDELLVMIRCPLETLKAFTDKINYKLRIDPAHLQVVLESGNPEERINPIHIRHDPEICPYTPYEHIYLQYGRHHDQKLYYVPHGATDPFVKSIRLKLTALLLRSPKRQGGCGLEISRLLHKKKILAFFPLHDRSNARAIQHKIWDKGVWPWHVPVEDVREYYGEKVALYNVFIGHYSLWIFTPSIIGIIFQIVVWATVNFSHPVLPFYSLVITVWSIYMLEYWKRQEATTALMWGMTDFESEEQDRPEFYGEIVKSHINGSDITFFPSHKSAQRSRLSRSVVLSFITMVVAFVAAIYTFRWYLQGRKDTVDAASTIASIINTVQIQIFNFIYQKVARKLTDMENHRVDTAYEDSLIVKLFLFQFINSYASFFFLAFIASNLERPDNAPINYLGQCGAENCMQPLSINLAIIFGSRLTIGNFTDIFLPYFFHKQKIRNETKGIAEDKTITPPEKDYMLLNYEPMIESIQNYADTAVQYGFSLLFVTALPIATFCSLISCYFKVKFNSWKLGTFYQRPVPEGVQDIGTWMTIFQVISVCSVVTNAALVCFTMDVLWDYSLQGRVWVFMGFQWVLIACQFLTQAVVPDVPEEVEIQMERNAFINSKVIEKVDDEDFGLEPEPIPDDHDDDDNEEDAKQSKGCCALGGSKKSTNVKNLANEYPVNKYPVDGNPLSWPQPLTTDPNANQAELARANSARGNQSQFQNYASGAAVANKDDGMTRNPTATYY